MRTHLGTAAKGRLRIFSLYADFPASVRSRWANSTLGQLAGPDWVTSAEMWKLDSLATSAAIRGMVTREALKADLLLVAVTSLNYCQHELMEWLATLAAGRVERHNAGLLIGLFGGEENHNSELDWTVKQCQKCARSMKRDFIWRWMDAGVMSDHAWLKDNLERFLVRKQMLPETMLPAGQRFAVA